MKRGKKYVEAAKAVDRATLYDTAEAISLVKKAAVAKFDETIEVHIRTGCDGRHADQQIRGAVVLPHGTGKKVRVLVFAKDAKAEEAKRLLKETTLTHKEIAERVGLKRSFVTMINMGQNHFLQFQHNYPQQSLSHHQVIIFLQNFQYL